MSIPGLNLTTPSWTSSSQLNSAYMLTIVGGVADATIDLANVRRMPKMRFVFLQTRALVARRTQPAQNVDHHPQSNSQCQLVEVKRRLMQIQLQPPSGHTPSRATAPGISSRNPPGLRTGGYRPAHQGQQLQAYCGSGWVSRYIRPRQGVHRTDTVGRIRSPMATVTRKQTGG
uniref:L308_F1_10 n=1 Tax=Mycobacterium leprae TaxID=1769 RepID=Q49911_MYCLR|nr:L308_F1_10 [Mycobacterium leprae]